MTTSAGWTEPADLIATLRRRWSRGTYLRAHARGEAWDSIALPVKGPSADDILQDPGAVVEWIEAYQKAASNRRGDHLFQIEWRTIRSRALGDNPVPARIRIDSIDQLAHLVGTTADLKDLASVLALTAEVLPEASAWVRDHPVDAIAHAADWTRLLSTVRWIVDAGPSTFDIRHLDIPDVDTKYVERNRKILGRLLDEVLPVNRIDPEAKDFARRYGFRARPRYVRFRLLAPVAGLPEELTEFEVRADELAGLPLTVRTVFVVENQASYLAFPDIPDAIVVFGAGFAVTTLELVPWLAEKQIIYWGDIDTHGFAILDRLRQRVPTVRSILMDRATLEAHAGQLVKEDSPTRAELGSLTFEEASIYEDLISGRYGPAVRLEQERVRFGLVRDALAVWRPHDNNVA